MVIKGIFGIKNESLGLKSFQILHLTQDLNCDSPFLMQRCAQETHGNYIALNTAHIHYQLPCRTICEVTEENRLSLFYQKK